MRMRLTWKKSLAVFGAMALAGAMASAAHAVTVVIGPGNVGISSINVNIVGTTITIQETWSNAGPGSLQFDELVQGTSYTVIKEITNNSGVAWNRLASELLDPAGQPNDTNDPQPYPDHVLAIPGFTTSNDLDGLSFAQGSPIPRVSNVWASVFEDELSDARDFLDFFNGVLPNGGVGTVQHGLRDNQVLNNEPFVLLQRPNEFSRPGQVPEPTTLLLLGSGLLGVGMTAWRRRSP